MQIYIIFCKDALSLHFDRIKTIIAYYFLYFCEVHMLGLVDHTNYNILFFLLKKNI